MPTEFEAKFLNINEKEIKDLLLTLGAKKVHDKIMLKRTVFSRCDESIRGFARVRDEGTGKITMTPPAHLRSTGCTFGDIKIIY